MIFMTIYIASVFLGLCIGSLFTLFVCWLADY